MISHCQLKAHAIAVRPRSEWAALVEKQGPCTHSDCTVKDCQRVLKDYLRSLALKQNAMRGK